MGYWLFYCDHHAIIFDYSATLTYVGNIPFNGHCVAFHRRDL